MDKLTTYDVVTATITLADDRVDMINQPDLKVIAVEIEPKRRAVIARNADDGVKIAEALIPHYMHDTFDKLLDGEWVRVGYFQSGYFECICIYKGADKFSFGYTMNLMSPDMSEFGDTGFNQWEAYLAAGNPPMETDTARGIIVADQVMKTVRGTELVGSMLVSS